MASLNRSLTWRQLLLTLLVLWVFAGVASLALTYLGGSRGVVRGPVHQSVHR